jgi:GNAT superfamily N-acetyltransferase
VGLPLPGVSLRITNAEGHDVVQGEVGEVRIAGASVFTGYHNLPEATAAAIGDGWMHTGDLGRQDADGYVHLVGRRSDLILRGGMNVYPPEVEAALLEVAGVEDVAVFGVPDPDLGERVAVAWVGAATQASLQAGVQRLAPFKRPVCFHPLEELPRNTMGKVQVAQLRRRFGGLWIRRGELSDAEFLTEGNLALALETENLVLHREVVERGVRTAISEGHGTYWIAEHEGAPVGQLMITTEWSDWRAQQVWWIQSVFVLPAFRKRGVLRALFDAIHAKAAAAGVAGLRLYVDQTNVSAADAYKRLGMSHDHYTVFERFDEVQ